MAGKSFSVFVNIGAKLLPSLNTAAGKVEERFALMGRRMKVTAAETRMAFKEMGAAIGPLGALAAAGGLSASFKGALGAGAEYQHQIAQMKLAGRTSKEVAAAIGESWKTINAVPTSTLSENLKIIQETTLAFGGVQHAIDNLQFNAKMGALLKGVMGDDFNEGAGFNALARVVELRAGKVGTKDYQRIASAFYRAISVSGGTVNPENLLGFAQQSLPGLRAYSEDYLARVVPSLIQEFGGERAGTVSSAFTRQIMGKVRMGGKGVVHNWQKLGLLKPGTGKGNNLSSTGWNPQDVVGYKLALSNPLEWFESVMIPRLKKAGININDPTEVLRVSSQLFGRETGARIASTFLDPKQLARIHADMGLYDKALNPNEGFAQAIKNDPTMGMRALSASFKNLETSLGNAALSSGVVGGLNALAGALNRLAVFFDKHPNFGKAFTWLLGIGAVTATLKVFGIALSWIFSPLTSFFRLLFSPVGAAGARIPWIVRIGRALAGLGRTIGPKIMSGLRLLGPLLLRGLAAAFGMLMTPAGWAILAVTAAVLIWKFRDKILYALGFAWGAVTTWIGGAWNSLTNYDFAGLASRIINKLFYGLGYAWTKVTEWWHAAWNAVVDYVLNIDWWGVASKIGSAISSGIKTALNPASWGIWGSFSAGAKAGAKTAAPATVPGGQHRAMGGPVRAGHWYWVNERGQEAFIPGQSGTVIPHSELQRRRAMKGGGVHVGTLNVNGVSDPEETARAVRRELYKMACAQDGFLND